MNKYFRSPFNYTIVNIEKCNFHIIAAKIFRFTIFSGVTNAAASKYNSDRLLVKSGTNGGLFKKNTSGIFTVLSMTLPNSIFLFFRLKVDERFPPKVERAKYIAWTICPFVNTNLFLSW